MAAQARTTAKLDLSMVNLKVKIINTESLRVSKQPNPRGFDSKYAYCESEAKL